MFSCRGRKKMPHAIYSRFNVLTIFYQVLVIRMKNTYFTCKNRLQMNWRRGDIVLGRRTVTQAAVICLLRVQFLEWVVSQSWDLVNPACRVYPWHDSSAPCEAVMASSGNWVARLQQPLLEFPVCSLTYVAHLCTAEVSTATVCNVLILRERSRSSSVADLMYQASPELCRTVEVLRSRWKMMTSSWTGIPLMMSCIASAPRSNFSRNAYLFMNQI